jgi:hypothetical protein
VPRPPPADRPARRWPPSRPSASTSDPARRCEPASYSACDCVVWPPRRCLSREAFDGVENLDPSLRTGTSPSHMPINPALSADSGQKSASPTPRTVSRASLAFCVHGALVAEVVRLAVGRRAVDRAPPLAMPRAVRLSAALQSLAGWCGIDCRRSWPFRCRCVPVGRGST